MFLKTQLSSGAAGFGTAGSASMATKKLVAACFGVGAALTVTPAAAFLFPVDIFRVSATFSTDELQ